ncbi:MAG: universal stress protein [Chloroflexi bacterium]|nr:MAG: universal stress protein [Chloroflexota bacterium]
MKFLLCTDGSDQATAAVRLGGRLAAHMGASVALLCIERPGRPRSRQATIEAQARELLQEQGITPELQTYPGGLLDALRRQIHRETYALVAVGYRERRFLEKVLFGSVAVRIAHLVPAPVLIVREPREALRRILIGISGHGFQEEEIRWGGEIARAFDGQVTLLHVLPPPPLMYTGLPQVSESLSDFLESDTEEARALREGAALLTKMGLPVELQLAYGLPEREVLRAAYEQDEDLVVVGSAWAVSPWQRLVLPNVTEQVLLHTRRPVLVVRPEKMSDS